MNGENPFLCDEYARCSDRLWRLLSRLAHDPALPEQVQKDASELRDALFDTDACPPSKAGCYVLPLSEPSPFVTLTRDEIQVVYDILGNVCLGLGPRKYHRRAMLSSQVHDKLRPLAPTHFAARYTPEGAYVGSGAPDIEGMISFTLPEPARSENELAVNAARAKAITERARAQESA